MKRFSRWTALLLFSLSCANAQLADPFSVDARMDVDTVRLEVGIPENHYLYAENLKVTDALGNEQKAVELRGTPKRAARPHSMCSIGAATIPSALFPRPGCSIWNRS